MDIFEDEICSQDATFDAPPLSVEHSPLPYLAEPCFRKPNHAVTHIPGTETLKQNDAKVYGLRGMDSFNPTQLLHKTDILCTRRKEITSEAKLKAFPLDLMANARTNETRPVLSPKQDHLMTCRYAMKFQKWTSDTIFPLDESCCLDKQAAQGSRCLKRPAVELFHPRQLKAVRHL